MQRPTFNVAAAEQRQREAAEQHEREAERQKEAVEQLRRDYDQKIQAVEQRQKETAEQQGQLVLSLQASIQLLLGKQQHQPS